MRALTLSLGTIKYSPLGKYASTERKGMISWSRYGDILHVNVPVCTCMHVLRKCSIASKETDLHDSILLYLHTHEADLDTGLLRLGSSIQTLRDNTSNYVRANPKKIQ